MPKENGDFDTNSLDWSLYDKLIEDTQKIDEVIEELSNQNQAELQKLLDAESLSNLDFDVFICESQPDIEQLLKDLDNWKLPLPTEFEKAKDLLPDPNLTSRDAADWMLESVLKNGVLYQEKAANHIRRFFGAKFIYRNGSSNSAICRDVLKEFLSISSPAVVWNRSERYWRLRHPNDPEGRRMVKS